MMILYQSKTYKWHVVQPGDYLYKLANQYKIAAKDIIMANPQINPNGLYIGQMIRIPILTSYNQISIYQEQLDIPAPEELYAKIKTADEERGVLEVITTLQIRHTRCPFYQCLRIGQNASERGGVQILLPLLSKSLEN
jgi:murein DD-endopeptidase MepM/ murein hydrolase activator NlpD